VHTFEGAPLQSTDVSVSLRRGTHTHAHTNTHTHTHTHTHTQDVIDKVRRSTAVDGSEVAAGEADAFSMEAFLAALREEAAASAGTFGDSGLVVAEGGAARTRTVGQAIAELRAGGKDAINWALFTVNV
jgi:hypothetical protein